MGTTNGTTEHNWTADEIQARLGTSTIVFERDRLCRLRTLR